jgi:hypothetical protein
MNWQVCIRYPNGQENALKRIDAIYSQGYPMHVAYVVRPAPGIEVALCQQEPLNHLQIA